jgi:hypothetical protein
MTATGVYGCLSITPDINCMHRRPCWCRRVTPAPFLMGCALWHSWCRMSKEAKKPCPLCWDVWPPPINSTRSRLPWALRPTCRPTPPRHCLSAMRTIYLWCSPKRVFLAGRPTYTKKVVLSVTRDLDIHPRMLSERPSFLLRLFCPLAWTRHLLPRRPLLRWPHHVAPAIPVPG